MRKHTTRERRRATARQAVPPPANASDYLVGITDAVDWCDAVVTYARVSSERQERNGTLARHEAWLRKAIEGLGITVLASFADVEQGKHLKAKNRKTLVKAIERAGRYGVPVVTHAPSRFLRHRDWDLCDQEVLPPERSFRRLMKLAGETRLITWLPPHATHDDEHALFSTIREDEGGRPMRPKHRREQYQARALRLFARGKSLREVSEILEVPKSTLQGWRNESKK